VPSHYGEQVGAYGTPNACEAMAHPRLAQNWIEIWNEACVEQTLVVALWCVVPV
jgi:hypothetical protein